MRIFPIITKKVQDSFETQQRILCIADGVPDICGYYGRACRQMDESEGANRMLCTTCPLAEYAAAQEKICRR